MSKYYPQADGSVGPYPDDIKEAKRLRSLMYYDREAATACKKCLKYTTNHIGNRYRHVVTGACSNCSRLNAGDFALLAMGATNVSTVDYTDNEVSWFVEHPYQHVDGQHFKERAVMRAISTDTVDKFRECLGLLGILDDSDPHVLTVTRRAFTTSTEAAKAGMDFLYVDDSPCKRAGHIGLRSVSGECYFCKQERLAPSPRQQAIDNGSKWYTPDTPCKRCHTLAERHVDNGRCRSCEDSQARTTIDADLMRDQPNMVMTRSDARTMGFKVYRTGRPCNKGHEGWRYVSTGGCIDCLKERC